MWMRRTDWLYAGEAGVQLTWMDAKTGDWVVTPRAGKAVEIKRPVDQRARDDDEARASVGDFKRRLSGAVQQSQGGLPKIYGTPSDSAVTT